MSLTLYILTQQRMLEALPPDQLDPSWPDDETQRWLDVETSDVDELKTLLRPLDLPIEILERCLEPGRGIYFAPHDQALYLEIPVLTDAHADRPKYLSVLCLPTTLITIHREPIPGLKRITTNMAGRVRLYAPDTSTLLYHVLENTIDQAYELLTDLREKFDDLVEAFVRDPQSVAPGDLFILRKPVTNLATTLEDHLYSTQLLLNVESAAFDLAAERERLMNLNRNTERLVHSVSAVREQGRALYQLVLLSQQERTNQRLRLLTIISAVFLPLSLLSGIYGMNFATMPGTDAAYGFPTVLGAMAAFAIAAMWLFYLKGWFR